MYHKRLSKQRLHRLSSWGWYKKLLARFVRLTVRLSLLSLIGYSGYRLYTASPLLYASFVAASRPQSVTVSYEKIYSASVQHQLRSHCDLLLSGSTFYQLDGNALYQELKKPVSLLSSCEYAVDREGNISLKLIGVDPTICLNGQYVVGEDQHLYDKSLFETYDFEHVGSIEVAQHFLNQTLDQSTYQFLQKVPNDRWKNYTIQYAGRHNITLKPLNSEKKYRVNADDQTFFNDRVFEYVDQLYEQLKVQSTTRRQRNRYWVFDIRFDKRIFVRPASEGEG